MVPKPLDLVIDIRMAFGPGIGTYIRQLVPRVFERLRVPTTVWITEDQRARLGEMFDTHMPTVVVQPRPLGVIEQYTMRRSLSPNSLFWATSLAHPLWHRGPMVATVYDVMQLALSPADGVPRGIALAAGLLLASQRKRAVGLMAISEFTRREFERYVGKPVRCQISVTPLGVGAAWFGTAKPQVACASPPYFIAVGSVRPHKNFLRLIQAFSRITERVPHELVFAGLAPGNGEHLRWLDPLPAAARSRIRFAGRVPDAELRALVAGADALVIPSLYEGFGLPALEAMAAGCPVLSSDAGSLPEVCAERGAGYFDPRSVEQMAQVLESHAKLPVGARQLIADGGIAHARRFTWDGTADATCKVLESALRGVGAAA